MNDEDETRFEITVAFSVAAPTRAEALESFLEFLAEAPPGLMLSLGIRTATLFERVEEYAAPSHTRSYFSAN